MNYTYSERVPKYNTKTTNPTIANFTPIDGNSIKRITVQRTTTTYKSLPIASRIPKNNQNIYNTLINNNRNSVNYPYVVSNTQIKEMANNNNEQIIDNNGPQEVASFEALRCKILLGGEENNPAQIRLELSCENDLFFHFTSDVDEETFKVMQENQKLTVNFVEYSNLVKI